MQQEKAIVHIYVTDGCAGFTIGRRIREFVIVAKSFSGVSCADAACDVDLLGDDVIPNLVNGFDIATITCNGRHICHAGIHIGGTDCVPDSFILFYNRFVRLAIGIFPTGISARIQKELGLVEIFLVTCHEIQFNQCHFCYLMSGNQLFLLCSVSDFPADAVSIFDSNIKKITFSRSLIMCNRTFYHVS